MNPVTVPFHLAFPALTSLLAAGLILINRQRLLVNSNYKSYWRATFIFCLIYAIVVGGATYSDIYCQWDINKYDLNRDGFFDKTEQSEGQIAAMKRLTNDTGRNFSFISGAFFSLVLALAAFIVSRGFDKYKRLKAEE